MHQNGGGGRGESFGLPFLQENDDKFTAIPSGQSWEFRRRCNRSLTQWRQAWGAGFSVAPRCQLVQGLTTPSLWGWLAANYSELHWKLGPGEGLAAWLEWKSCGSRNETADLSIRPGRVPSWRWLWRARVDSRGFLCMCDSPRVQTLAHELHRLSKHPRRNGVAQAFLEDGSSRTHAWLIRVGWSPPRGGQGCRCAVAGASRWALTDVARQSDEDKNANHTACTCGNSSCEPCSRGCSGKDHAWGRRPSERRLASRLWGCGRVDRGISFVWMLTGCLCRRVAAVARTTFHNVSKKQDTLAVSIKTLKRWYCLLPSALRQIVW